MSGTEKTGSVSVRRVFRSSRLGNIAGCFVDDGFARRDSLFVLVRGGERLWSGRCESFRRFRDDVQEVKGGFEVGIKLKGYDDIQEGDVLEAWP